MLSDLNNKSRASHGNEVLQNRSRLNLDKHHLDRNIVGVIRGRIYGGARSFLVASFLVDGDRYVVIYGAIYAT